MGILFFVQGLINEIFKKGRATHTPPARNFEVDKNLDLVKDIKPGDVVLYRFMGEKDFVGGVISYVTTSPYCHAEVHMFNGYNVSADAVGVTFVDMFKKNQKQAIDVFRLKRKLTREERLIVQAKALQAIHSPYDYVNLAGFIYLTQKGAVKRAANQAYMCSELVAWAYDNAGIKLIKGKPESIVAPGDLGRAEVLKYVGTYESGKKVRGSFRNQFRGAEQGTISKMLAKIIGLFSVKDEYYKGLAINQTMLEGDA